MKNIKIYLIRHGQSEINALEDQIGQKSDTPLTIEGKYQGKYLGLKFRDEKIVFDKIFSSPYARAANTAKNTFNITSALNNEKEIIYDDRLVEYNPGDWTGHKRSEIYSDPKNVMSMGFLQMGFPFPNGDTLHRVERRMASWVEESIIYNKEVLAMAEKKDVNIAAFSHGQAIKCLLHYIMGFDQSFLWKIHIYNTGIQLLVYNDKGWFLKSINDTAHLVPGAPKTASQ